MITTTLGEEATVITNELETDETSEAGTATGLTQFDGTTTTVGG